VIEVRFTRRAADEICLAQGWYESQQRGLGQQFVGFVDEVIATLQRTPNVYVSVGGGYRRAVLKKFPFSLVYQVRGDVVVIAGCMHHRRESQFWLRTSTSK
jgi:hypothetical protein